MNDPESIARRAPSLTLGVALLRLRETVALVRRRWRGIALVLLALAAVSSARAVLSARREARVWEAWFASDTVPELRIWLDDAARASLARRPREFVRAELEHDGERRLVGLRLKGHRSMKPLEAKAAFKIAFDHFEASQRFFGARRVTLNNMVEDPTSLREFLGYRVFREVGVASPRVAYASVSLDGQPRGLYALVEDIDDLVERAPKASRARVVYEGEYGCDLFPEDVPGFDRDYGKDPGRAELRALAGAANGDARALFDAAAGPLDMPAFLSFLAASAVVGDFDGYRHSHNYRIQLVGEQRRWQFLPWGLDRAFQRPLGIFDSQGWLAKRCFAEPACRLQYVRTLRAATERFEALRLEATAQELGARLDALAGAGAQFGPRAGKVAAERRELEAFIRARPAEIRAQLGCIDASGNELDRDGDGQGCMDCNDSDRGVGPHVVELCDGVDNDCNGLVDDAPACACEERQLSGRTYHLCNWPMPWREAQTLCEQKGLVLARVDSKRTSQALYREASALEKSAWWIGYSDHGQEGRFLWREGDAGSFTHWDEGQPNNRSCNEDCVALREGEQGRWQDSPCNQHRPFICAERTEAETLGAAEEAPSRAAE